MSSKIFGQAFFKKLAESYMKELALSCKAEPLVALRRERNSPGSAGAVSLRWRFAEHIRFVAVTALTAPIVCSGEILFCFLSFPENFRSWLRHCRRGLPAPKGVASPIHRTLAPLNAKSSNSNLICNFLNSHSRGNSVHKYAVLCNSLKTDSFFR